ncbi:hypothetical protein B0H11DRAFT_2245506 [Mycena galericulata]|nr:hypothetical protein B0H11DRAFT_2245506 [Mycena galericulata]
MSTLQNTTIISELYGSLEYELWTASAALFFNGICLILFALAVFFLQKAKTRASRLFLFLSGGLVLFALAQVVLDVTLAAIFLQMTHTLVDGGSAIHLASMYRHIYEVREVLLAVNNAITDSVLIILKLYRCATIWGASRYSRIVIAFPSLLILSTLVVGLWGIFAIDTDTPIPFSLALVTNFVLLGLTAGKIWIKGRQTTILLGVQAGRRYNRTLEIMRSSLLYFVNVLVYLIASVTQPFGLVSGVAWGALPQVVNIVPLMIMFRVGIARNSGEQEGNLRTFYGGNAGSFEMNTLLKSSAQ